MRKGWRKEEIILEQDGGKKKELKQDEGKNKELEQDGGKKNEL